MTLGVLITNYKAWSTTEATLLAVIALHPNESDVQQIVVLDDASDAPDSWLGDPRVQFYRNPSNLGYIRSVNVGMSKLVTDIVVVFDCDARPLTPFADQVRRIFLASSNLGVVGFNQTDETKLLRPSGELTPTLREFIIGPSLFSRLPSKVRQKILPSGRFLCIHSCCMAVRTSAFRSVGGFDETFDFLDGDMDFSWTLLEQKWKTEIMDVVVCFHPGGGSPQSTNQRVLRHHQNRWQLLKKHGHINRPRVAKALLFVRHFVECIALFIMELSLADHRFRGKFNTRLKLLRGVISNYR